MRLFYKEWDLKLYHCLENFSAKIFSTCFLFLWKNIISPQKLLKFKWDISVNKINDLFSFYTVFFYKNCMTNFIKMTMNKKILKKLQRKKFYFKWQTLTPRISEWKQTINSVNENVFYITHTNMAHIHNWYIYTIYIYI